MPEFIDDRFPVAISYGSSFGEEYAVEIDTTANGNEYRRLRHNHPRIRYDISFEMREQDWIMDEVLDFYHRAFGKFVGFRVKNLADYTSNTYRGATAPTDQPLANLTATTWQLQKQYGLLGPSATIGYPKRIIRKPVLNTVAVATSGITSPANRHSVDYSTGIVTFTNLASEAILGISNATQAVITIASPNSITTADTVIISGVNGMTSVNNIRVAVVAVTSTTITINLNTTSAGTWTSGGVVQNNPLPTEGVTAGFEFDVPMRFDSDLGGLSFDTFETISASGINLVEILNP